MRRSNEKSLAQVATENGIAYSSLKYRMTEKEGTIDEAVVYLKNLKNAPKTIYIYGRQRFENIISLSESKIHNPEKVRQKTLEQRIRNLKNSELEPKFDEQNPEIVYSLPEKIFEPARKHPHRSVTTPDGKTLTGTIKNLHDELKEAYPDLVPSGYTTVQGRIKKPNWTIEQAFGFEYPPDLLEIKPLIEEKGYTWACNKPDFKKQNSKPVVLHSRKEVFTSQEEFCKTYKGLKTDLVSDHITAGKTAEEILKYYGLVP